eukprot:gnl/MRDRNA2_/MRDRNA2_171096_c0_seq1.p1 gnl/MRDRNA2_/MRDRNA2_171096_c0~~gnl/MRDRNA2_/MRDRNA2_171096_c0_seq1.p1  ORF type:complete len:367 (-),score=59.53 gnl/MRDRNA2_/MRDRNA2_171096_c0_seq1:18-1118(-)
MTHNWTFLGVLFHEFCPKEIEAMLKSYGLFFREAVDSRMQISESPTRHLIFKIICRCMAWFLNCRFVGWFLELANKYMWPAVVLLAWFSERTAELAAGGQEEEEKKGVVDVEVILLSGETIAQLTVPKRTIVRELRKEMALRDKTSPGRLKLLFEEIVLSDDAIVHDVVGERRPRKLTLQLIRRESRNFTPSQSNEYNLLNRILLVGDSGAGKTNILNRFADGTFTESFISTIGVDFKIRNVACDEGVVAKLQMWDTAGQERFRIITPSYYQGANAFILVFDVSDRECFERLPFWLEEIRKHARADALVCLLGNKTDLMRFVPRKEAEEFAANNDLKYFEVSAKTDTDVCAPFYHLTDVLMDRAGL